MSGLDSKQDVSHIENGDHHDGDSVKGARVADDVAADFVDPTVQISPEENKSLRRRIYKQ
jgi:hypothetical protein